MRLKHREIQTRVKHEILRQYLIKWYSIITGGLANRLKANPKLRDRFQAQFIYVDYFAYSGAYEDGGVAVDGSPVIGIKALDNLKTHFSSKTDGLIPWTAAILFEEDENTFQELVVRLSALGWRDRLKRLDKQESLKDGDIGLICGDSSQYVDRVLNYVESTKNTYTFHFIDPYGFRAVERDNIQRIVASKGADCIINMMFDPIYRFLKPAAQEVAGASEKVKAEYYDKYFGTLIWREIAQELQTGVIDGAQAEQKLVHAFESILKNADDTLGVKRIRLQFAERDKTYYHLFLTTHDPYGAFAMNEVLSDAEIRQYDYREELRHMRKRGPQTAFDFLDELEDEKRPKEAEPDFDGLAESILEKCRGRVLTYREVLLTMINSPHSRSDIGKALGRLRDQNRAFFDNVPSKISRNTVIRFQ